MITRFYVFSEVAAISPEELRTMCWAVTCQIATDFAPAWGLEPVVVEARETPEDLPTGEDFAIIRLANQADSPDALGDHFYAKQPLGTIGIAPILLAGGGVLEGSLSVSAVLSHEVLETLADEAVNKWAAGLGKEWAWEVCDPCEADSYVVEVENVGKATVSNFVTPDWFVEEASGKVDWLGTCPGPFQLAPGGYAVRKADGGQVEEIFGNAKTHERPAFRPWHHPLSVSGDQPRHAGPGWRSKARLVR